MVRNIIISLLLLIFVLVFEGFEQWKSLVDLLCNCDDALVECHQMYEDLMSKLNALMYMPINCIASVILHYQLEETPQDFFVDIVSRDNFLTVVLRVGPAVHKRPAKVLIVAV